MRFEFLHLFLLFVQKKNFWIKQVFYLYIFKGLGWVGFGCFLGVFWSFLFVQKEN